jgi:FkbM family methyltransferase
MYFLDRYFIKQPRLRRFVTRMLAGDSDKKIEVIGTGLTVNTIKENGYLRASKLCRRSSLLKDEVAMLINLAFILDGRDTFVDVGANVGIFTHTFSRFRKVSPSLSVHAFEANPDTFSRLVGSLAEGVRAEQKAISKETGKLEFVEGGVSHVFTTTAHVSSYNIKGSKPIVVAAERLDACDIAGDSLVIKVDVEGQEKEVLLGASGLFEAGRVKAFYMDGYEDRSVETILKNYGFRLFDGRTLQPTEGGIFSLLALNPKKVSWLT